MFDIIELRNVIVKGIQESTGLPIVPTNSVDNRPIAPYHSYNFITPYAPRDSPITWVTTDKDEGNVMVTRGELPSITLSLLTHSNAETDIECMQEAFELRKWFYHDGNDKLKRMGIVITNIGAIQDRTILQNETEYQYRVGFDVQMRVINKTANVVSTIEEVEHRQETKK